MARFPAARCTNWSLRAGRRPQVDRANATLARRLGVITARCCGAGRGRHAFLCCHPSLTLASQVALTPRVVGGLATTEIAHALLVPVSTKGQRTSRAKQTIKASGAEFHLPPPMDRAERLPAVEHVLYRPSSATPAPAPAIGRTVNNSSPRLHAPMVKQPPPSPCPRLHGPDRAR
jgi:hypothetical protein